MNKVAILFYFSVLPDGSAGAARIVVLAKLLKSIGYHPVMLGVAYTENKPVRATYEGIEYELLSFPELTLNGIHAIQRTSAIQKHLQQWLDAYRDQNGIDLILFTEYQGFAHFFQTYAQKNKIKLIQNVVEWYPREGFPGILGSLRYLKHTYDMRWGYKFTGNIIGISSFLCKHFAQQGCRTIRIPTIVDIDTYDIADAANENKVVLAYAGVPWGKDCVMNVIRAITQLNQDEKERVQFNIYGVTADEVIENGHLNDEEKKLIGKQVRCFGRIPYAQVQTEIKKADFTVLLRENTRKNTAGFPTKLGESMAAGVPVIANLTGDIGLYLHDGVEGLVCEDETPNTCVTVLRRALDLSSDEKNSMRVSARAQAEASFNYRNYEDQMKKFCNGVEYQK